MKNSIERIREFIEFQGISERKFYFETNLSESSFNKIKSVGSENLKKIFHRYPELNMDWVITGRGEMLYSSTAAKNGVPENFEKKYYALLEKYNSCLEASQKKKAG